MLAPGTRRRRQVWDSLFTGDMLEEGMGDCPEPGKTPPPGTARPVHHLGLGERLWCILVFWPKSHNNNPHFLLCGVVRFQLH